MILLKDLGRYIVFCTIAKFGIFASSLLVLVVGRSIGFYVVGIPILILSAVMVVLCNIMLIGKLKNYLNFYLLIAEDILFLATVILSIIFTPATLVETTQWFSFKYEITTWHIIGFAVLYIAMMTVPAFTDRKICKAYVKLKSEQ